MKTQVYTPGLEKCMEQNAQKYMLQIPSPGESPITRFMVATMRKATGGVRPHAGNQQPPGHVARLRTNGDSVRYTE